MNKLSSDLLVAILAIMTDAIPQSALAQALRAWTDHPGQSLTHWLKHSAGLDDARIRAFECLAVAHLKAHQNDLRLSLNAWNAFDLTQDLLTELHDDALRTTLGASLGGSKTILLDGQAPESSASWILNRQPRATDGERFQLIRPHAKGGIGQVWVARDSELQRDVALKEIQPRFAERDDHRARFVLEAEITGNLEHPGIVPVYSLGQNADGRPYYAMRFIQGESFAVAIRRFHKDRREHVTGAKSPARPSWGIDFRQLLRRFLDVCDAIDYAHSRGVLHRDLKPANIMLGRYGETLVVDWGLAKVIGKTDVVPAPEARDFEPNFAGSSVSFSGATLQGTTIGTPSYMSPEQARGDIDELGPGSDVFSLGATLYELLTGEVPFPGKSVPEIIDKVMKGEFQRPRALDRSIPPALEAVAMKALAGEPERRYHSVRAMAQDLEHWLADEPVAAYPERRLERLGRWLRQHRTWTYAAAAALFGISLAATIGMVVVEQARRREAAIRKENETNFLMAQTAVNDYLTSVSENTLLKQQDSVDIRGLRRELLNSALNYYKKFVKQRGDDPQLRRQLANAYFRVGQITREIDSPSEAIEAFHSAQVLWEPMVAAEPANHELRGRLAECNLAIGEIQAARDDFQPAMQSLARARDLFDALAKAHPEVTAYSANLAACYMRIGIIQSDRKAVDSALAALAEAKTIQERLIARDPGPPANHQALGEIRLAMGNLFFEQQDYAAALRSFEETQRICQAQLDNVTLDPKPVHLLDLLAISHYNIAAIQIKLGAVDDALASFERTLEYRIRLMEGHPSVTQHKEQLGKTLAEIAIKQHEVHQDEKAFASIKKSIAILEKLVEAQKDQPRYHHDLGRSWNIQGFLHDENRENTVAIREFNDAITEERIAVAAAPEVDLYKTELANQLDNLGEQYIDLGQVSQGMEYYREEILILQQLLTARPKNESYALLLAEALAKLGDIERHDGDSAAAADTFKIAQEALGGVGSTSAEVQARLGAVLTRRAVALADLQKASEALPLLRQAVDLLSHVATSKKSEQNDRVREWLTESLWELSTVAAAASDQEPTTLGKRKTLWATQDPAKLATWALKQTSQALLIGFGKTPVNDRARSVREHDLDRATASLDLAIALGFKDLKMLRANQDFWALADRRESAALIKSLEARNSDGPSQPQREQ